MKYTDTSDIIRLIKEITNATEEEMTEALGRPFDYYHINSLSFEDFGKVVTYFGLRMTIQPNGDVVFELTPETKELIMMAFNKKWAEERKKLMKNIGYKDYGGIEFDSWEPEELR